MKRVFLAVLLSLAAVGVLAQTATYTPPVLPPLFTPADLTSSAVMMNDVSAAYNASAQLLLAHDAAMHGTNGYDAQIAAIQSKLTSIPTGTTGAAPASDYLLASSLGSPASWPMTVALGEFDGTRRMMDFTNVNQVRLCYNMQVGGGTGSSIELDQRSSQGVWGALVGPVDVSTASLPTCTAWTAYAGSAGDSLIRIAGASPNAATSQFWAIDLQVR